MRVRSPGYRAREPRSECLGRDPDGGSRGRAACGSESGDREHEARGPRAEDARHPREGDPLIDGASERHYGVPNEAATLRKYCVSSNRPQSTPGMAIVTTDIWKIRPTRARLS